jgi:hypothetical protein
VVQVFREMGRGSHFRRRGTLHVPAPHVGPGCETVRRNEKTPLWPKMTALALDWTKALPRRVGTRQDTDGLARKAILVRYADISPVDGRPRRAFADSRK